MSYSFSASTEASALAVLKVENGLPMPDLQIATNLCVDTTVLKKFQAEGTKYCKGSQIPKVHHCFWRSLLLSYEKFVLSCWSRPVL